MKISKINYAGNSLNKKSFKNQISPEYIGLISRKISNVQADVKSLKEKTEETNRKQDIIIQQNKDILTALYLTASHKAITAPNMPWVQEIKELSEKNYK